MSNVSKTADADTIDDTPPAEMSTAELQAEISAIDETVQWFGCVAAHRSQWRRYQALTDELDRREAHTVPACPTCDARQWYTTRGVAIHCRSCGETPSRTFRSMIREVWAMISDDGEVPDDV